MYLSSGFSLIFYDYTLRDGIRPEMFYEAHLKKLVIFGLEKEKSRRIYYLKYLT